MHRAVHVADQMDQHDKLDTLLLGFQSAVLQLLDDRFYGRQYVALRIAGHRFERLSFVDIQIVPRLRIGVLGRMAGIVEPVGVVNQRVAVQHFVHIGRGLRHDVAFGDVGRNVVSFLSPGQRRTGYAKTSDQEQ